MACGGTRVGQTNTPPRSPCSNRVAGPIRSQGRRRRPQRFQAATANRSNIRCEQLASSRIGS